MTVIRLTEAGGWDRSWGHQGAYKAPVRATPDTVANGARAHATHLKFLGDGRLAVIGQFTFREDPPDYPGTMTFETTGVWSTRLHSGGAVDVSYGTNGYAEQTQEDSDVSWGTTRSLALAPDGAVIGVVNLSTDYPEGDPVTFGFNWRISPDGSEVSNIQIAPAVWDEQFDVEQINSPVVVQADGKIVAKRSNDQRMFRSNVDDTIDPSFGDDGLVDTKLTPFNQLA
jgi:hypothetical protein